MPGSPSIKIGLLKFGVFAALSILHAPIDDKNNPLLKKLLECNDKSLKKHSFLLGCGIQDFYGKEVLAYIFDEFLSPQAIIHNSRFQEAIPH